MSGSDGFTIISRMGHEGLGPPVQTLSETISVCGVGSVGRPLVETIARNPETFRAKTLVIADFDGQAAEGVAAHLTSRYPVPSISVRNAPTQPSLKIVPIQLDATDTGQVEEFFREHKPGAIVNSGTPYANLPLMKAAATLREPWVLDAAESPTTHNPDGTVKRRLGELEMGKDAFLRSRGIRYVGGNGADPGMNLVLARHLLQQVDSDGKPQLKKAGTICFYDYSDTYITDAQRALLIKMGYDPMLLASYALQVFFDENTEGAILRVGNKTRYTPARADLARTLLPEGGDRKTICAEHDEILLKEYADRKRRSPDNARYADVVFRIETTEDVQAFFKKYMRSTPEEQEVMRRQVVPPAVLAQIALEGSTTVGVYINGSDQNGFARAVYAHNRYSEEEARRYMGVKTPTSAVGVQTGVLVACSVASIQNNQWEHFAGYSSPLEQPDTDGYLAHARNFGLDFRSGEMSDEERRQLRDYRSVVKKNGW